MDSFLLDRFSELFRLRNEKLEVAGNNLFISSNRIITSFSPALERISVSDSEADKTMRKLNGFLIRWSEGDTTENQAGEWFAVICDKFTPTESLPSKLRGEINKGLSNFTVRRIDPEYLARDGFNIYISTVAGYRNYYSSKFDKASFSDYCNYAGKYDDIQHFWGIFSGDMLIGYSSVYVFGTTEALYSTIKIIPEYMANYANYALIYTMNQYYLAQNKLGYVNDGYRSLLHDTNIQDFLIRKFGFRKKNLSLKVHYATMVGTFINLAYPFRSVLELADKRMHALFELERIRRSFPG